MEIETKTKTIEGLDLETSAMSPLTNYPLGLRLMRTLAPVLTRAGSLDSAALAAMVADTLELASTNVGAALGTVGPLLEAVLGELSKPDNARLPTDLLAGTVAIVLDEDGSKTRVSLGSVDGINRVFQGRLFAMIAAMFWAAQVNFSDFFHGISATARARAEKAAKAKASA